MKEKTIKTQLIELGLYDETYTDMSDRYTMRPCTISSRIDTTILIERDDNWGLVDVCSKKDGAKYIDFQHPRQSIPVDRKSGWSAETIAYQFEGELRRLCQQRGATPIHVAGGVIPIHYNDEVAIPDFNMNGAWWYILPKKLVDRLVCGH